MRLKHRGFVSRDIRCYSWLMKLKIPIWDHVKYTWRTLRSDWLAGMYHIESRAIQTDINRKVVSTGSNNVRVNGKITSKCMKLSFIYSSTLLLTPEQPFSYSLRQWPLSFFVCLCFSHSLCPGQSDISFSTSVSTAGTSEFSGLKW